MSKEATVRVGLTVRKLDSTDATIILLDFNQSAAFQADVTGTFGPTPGTVAVPAEGVSIPLTGITDPGWCWIHNQSASANLQVGVKDPDSALFYPLLELKPGWRLPVPLSGDLYEQYEGTGTGTGGPTNQLFLRAINPSTRSATTGTAYVGAFQV